MPYVVEDYYLAGMPQTALVGGLASRGIGEHWTAGQPGREGARATARWMVETADRNASYHELHWWEQGTRSYGVIRIVSAIRAAHSFNPNPPTWSPNAEVRRILGDRVGDPNAVTYACSFAGMPADLAAAMSDPYFVECEVRRRRELLAQEDTIKVERPLFNHGWGQPTTRSDAGDVLIPAIYRALYPEEFDMPTPALHYVPQLWKANAGGAELREQADLAAPVVAMIPAGGILFTIGEASSDRQGWRLAVAGDPEQLWYVRRAQITAMPPTPRDLELHRGIATVVNARVAGQAVPVGGVPDEEHREAVAAASLSGFSAGRTKAIAAYTAGGTKAAQEVTP